MMTPIPEKARTNISWKHILMPLASNVYPLYSKRQISKFHFEIKFTNERNSKQTDKKTELQIRIVKEYDHSS